MNSAQADGPLTVGSVFRWQTAALDITSTVEEVDAPHRIAWGGPAQGIVAVHVWTLDERDDSVLVSTAESWEGDPVSAMIINIDRKNRSINLSIKAKDHAEETEAIQTVKADTAGTTSGTTNLGALLRAKMDNKTPE
jgi:ribosomal protein S1